MTYGGMGRVVSWEQSKTDLREELRKWGVEKYALTTKKEAEEIGAVTVIFFKNGVSASPSCSRWGGEWQGPERNLRAIVGAVQSARLADQRGIGTLWAEIAKTLALPPGDDPYRVLGLTKEATPAEVRKAYLQKAQETHPDHGGNETDFRRIKEAAEKLGVA